MRKKFILFLLAESTGILLIFPWWHVTFTSMAMVVVGSVFIAAAGVLNWLDLGEVYKEKLGE